MGSHFLDRLLGRRTGEYEGHHKKNSRGHGYETDHSTPTAVQRLLVCPNCRSDNASTSHFCANCGQRFGLLEATCPECNAPIAAHSKFCSSCGKAVAFTGSQAR
ncbi:zinc-ribbon domain-containing protein [Pigmentiphaga kullae]|uniref:zinc-ribbon domain-containing protein n=1 Tax=Pigmentiphaga kullae TaxID=151784 RepID=UPI00102ABF11